MGQPHTADTSDDPAEELNAGEFFTLFGGGLLVVASVVNLALGLPPLGVASLLTLITGASLFVVGFTTITTDSPDEYLLVLSGAMMGVGIGAWVAYLALP